MAVRIVVPVVVEMTDKQERDFRRSRRIVTGRGPFASSPDITENITDYVLESVAVSWAFTLGGAQVSIDD